VGTLNGGMFVVDKFGDVILDLCSGTGSWSKPYRENGYTVVEVEVLKGDDVRLLGKLEKNVFGILCAPPCQHFASSGARWWKQKGKGALLEGLSIVDACLRAVTIYHPTFWCLENPVGRLSYFLGKPRFAFHPYEYAAYSDDPSKEAYTKKTYLWGNFNIPVKRSVEPVLGSFIHKKLFGWSKTEDGFGARAVTPQGFARAFYLYNKKETLDEWFI
jgi:hypothetical protein